MAAKDQERVHSLDIRLARGQRPNAIVAGRAEEHPMLDPGVRVRDELELPTRQRVEGMDDPKSLLTVTMSCS